MITINLSDEAVGVLLEQESVIKGMVKASKRISPPVDMSIHCVFENIGYQLLEKLKNKEPEKVYPVDIVLLERKS